MELNRDVWRIIVCDFLAPQGPNHDATARVAGAITASHPMRSSRSNTRRPTGVRTVVALSRVSRHCRSVAHFLRWRIARLTSATAVAGMHLNGAWPGVSLAWFDATLPMQPPSPTPVRASPPLSLQRLVDESLVPHGVGLVARWPQLCHLTHTGQLTVAILLDTHTEADPHLHPAPPTAPSPPSGFREVHLVLDTVSDLPCGLAEAALPATTRVACRSLGGLGPLLADLPRLEEFEFRGRSGLSAGGGPAALPEAFGSLARLQRCSIQQAVFKRLPAGFTGLAALTTLEISGSHLAALPADLGRLQSLTSLTLSACDLAELPADLGRLSRLRHLDVSWNRRLTTLWPDAASAGLASLATLSASQCVNLGALPGSLGQLPCLAVLDLHDCFSLRALPDGLCSAPALAVLNLRNCRALQHLPDRIGDLSALRELDVSLCPLLAARHAAISSRPPAARDGRAGRPARTLPRLVGSLHDLNRAGYALSLPAAIGVR